MRSFPRIALRGIESAIRGNDFCVWEGAEVQRSDSSASAAPALEDGGKRQGFVLCRAVTPLAMDRGYSGIAERLAAFSVEPLPVLQRSVFSRE